MRPVLTLLLVLLGGAIQVCSAGAEETSKGRSNRLIQEKSPYLLQHAYNPVDWYPWGEEAFRLAREENRPIFLSVGYSTCYWCHVMEREVFENPGIADLMNRYFVNIKVDREERPDVDRIYMSALQALTGSGGWPMSMFLTPELEPFFGRTYVPPETFRALIGRIHEVWVKNRDDIAEAGRQLTEFLREQARVEAGDALLGVSILKKGYESIRAGYDETYGGFGRGNKFPRPVVFNFLLRYHRREAKSRALEMTLTTLKGMATSGIFDHLEGGFHRYSVDRQWRVPHFEKMLYDQAQLVNSYLEAYQSTRNPLFASMARRTLDYVSRRLTHPPGGFYSAEDAESATDPSQPNRKREGAFYVWTQAELDRILGPERGAVFAHSFGVEPDGNAPSDPHQVFVNQNILYRAHSLEETARKFKRSPDQVESVLEESRRRLLQTRNQRLRPHLDDKILVSWNGLMISAFARAHQVLGEAEYLEQARRAADFILKHLYQQETGRLLRRYREGEARFEAHLEDYAFLVMGLIDLYQAGSDIRDLERSMELMEDGRRPFLRPGNGGLLRHLGTRRVADPADPGRLRRGRARGELGRRLEPPAPGGDDPPPGVEETGRGGPEAFREPVAGASPSPPPHARRPRFPPGHAEAGGSGGRPVGRRNPGSARGGPFHLRSQQGPPLCRRWNRTGIPGEEQSGRPGHGSRRREGDRLRLRELRLPATHVGAGGPGPVAGRRTGGRRIDRGPRYLRSMIRGSECIARQERRCHICLSRAHLGDASPDHAA